MLALRGEGSYLDRVPLLQAPPVPASIFTRVPTLPVFIRTPVTLRQCPP